LSESGEVSFESALAAFVVSPKIPNRVTTTAIPMRFDLLETFLLCKNSDIERPFEEMKFDGLNAVAVSNSERLLGVVTNY
jgi:hypothetical protein